VRGEQVSLETLVEVVHAKNGVADGQKNEKNGDDGKRGQRPSSGNVALFVGFLVHAAELEDEVAEAAEVEDDDGDHADSVFTASEEGGGEKDDNTDGNGDDGQDELNVPCAGNNDDKLDDEAQEEEEVEFEEGDVDLVVKEASLHSVVSADVLEDVPSEFLVQLPADEGQDHGAEAEDCRNRGKEWTDIVPSLIKRVDAFQNAFVGKRFNGRTNGVDLDAGVDDQSQVGNANANDLNRVLHAKGIPDDNQLVKEPEDEEGEECGDGQIFGANRCILNVASDARLDRSKNVPMSRC
jgi:hypothetical protein